MGVEMDTSDDEFLESTSIHDLGENFLKFFCKKVVVSFLNEFGLISHQINSYNDFIKNGIQGAFNSFGEIIVEPRFNPSQKGEGQWRYASVRFRKVILDLPIFQGKEGNVKEFNMLSRHVRLQNMTYSARMKVNIDVQLYTQKLVISDQFKTGKYQFVDRDILIEENRDFFFFFFFSQKDSFDCEV